MVFAFELYAPDASRFPPLENADLGYWEADCLPIGAGKQDIVGFAAKLSTSDGIPGIELHRDLAVLPDLGEVG